MMTNFLDSNQRIRFTPEFYITHPRIEIILKPLIGSDLIELLEHFDNKGLKLSIDYIFYLLEKSIVEMTGFTDMLEGIDSLPTEVISELVFEILRINYVIEQRKIER